MIVFSILALAVLTCLTILGAAGHAARPVCGRVRQIVLQFMGLGGQWLGCLYVIIG